MGYRWTNNEVTFRALAQLSDEALFRQMTVPTKANTRTLVLSEIKARGLWTQFQNQQDKQNAQPNT
jgi:hypothetical protein